VVFGAPGMAGGMKEKNHHFSWENPGFLWQFSIANCLWLLYKWLVVWIMNFTLWLFNIAMEAMAHL